MKLIKSIILLFFFIVILVIPAKASYSQKFIEAKFTENPPKIDGILNDSCWKEAPKVEDFVQREPDIGQKATERTIVYCLYDRSTLYFGFKMMDAKPEKIVAEQIRRDSDLTLDDFIMVMLDTYNDDLSGYYFAVNPINTQLDGQIREQANIGKEWDGDWKSKTRTTDEGWVAELAIPFNILKFSKENKTWGINFYRLQKRKEEYSYWANTGVSPYRVSFFGDLRGLKEIKQKIRLHILPYSTVRYEKHSSSEKYSKISKTGVDINYKITPDISTTLTYEPDFCQVEPDEVQINLSKETELCLPEKRPFFLEDFGLFDTDIPVFYSRRISDIDYGVKTSGKMSHLGVDGGAFYIRSPQSTNYWGLRLKKYAFRRSHSIGIIGVGKEESNNNYDRAFGLDIHIHLGKSFGMRGNMATNFASDLSRSNNAYETWIQFKTSYHKSLKIIFSGSYRDYEKSFRPEVGYISRNDIKGPNGTLAIYFFPPKWGLYRIDFIEFLQGLKDHDGHKVLYGPRETFQILFKNGLGFSYYDNRFGHRYGDDYYPNAIKAVDLLYAPTKLNSFDIGYMWGKYYGSNMKYPYIMVSSQVFNALVLGLSIDYQYIEYPGIIEKYWINTLELDCKLTSKLSCRAFIQSFEQKQPGERTEQTNRKINLNFLVKYDISAGSHLYFVWNEGHGFVDKSYLQLPLQNRTIFLKFVYDFGIKG